MPEMKSLGKPAERSLGTCSVELVDKDVVYYPYTHVDGKQMPEIDEWEVGEEYVVTVKMRMTSYSLDESSKQGSRSSASFELLEYATKAPKSLS